MTRMPLARRGPAARAYALGLAIAGVLLAGCGPHAETAKGGNTKTTGGCSLIVEELSKATSLSWELKEKRDDHPLETLESVKASVCLYTAADAPQAGSDPLVLRTDTVGGKDVAAVRQDFTESCTGYDGKIRKSAAADGAVVCDRGGAVVEGLVESVDRLVSVYFVNADKSTATKLTKKFDAILTAVG
ncbi:hypothetical protein AB0H88_31985 [Nonomuraea sp. NPDC050680]|uniref:hypothetical protein n=1 Tax=Nonomuraea sp. NPDC050680 TaxID=3154630 RepID=UPI0033F827AF